jgi:hypothetical protein
LKTCPASLLIQWRACMRKLTAWDRKTSDCRLKCLRLPVTLGSKKEIKRWKMPKSLWRSNSPRLWPEQKKQRSVWPTKSTSSRLLKCNLGMPRSASMTADWNLTRLKLHSHLLLAMMLPSHLPLPTNTHMRSSFKSMNPWSTHSRRLMSRESKWRNSSTRWKVR